MAYKVSRPKKGATIIKHGKSGGFGVVKTTKTKSGGIKTVSYNYKKSK